MDSDNAYIYGARTTPRSSKSTSPPAPSIPRHDLLGSVRGIVSSTAAPSPHPPPTTPGATPKQPADSPPTPHSGYAGGYTDPTGLIYLIGRYYDPQTGQFTTVDPIVDVTQSPYIYVSDDPVLASDPAGDCPLVNGMRWLQGAYVPAPLPWVAVGKSHKEPEPEPEPVDQPPKIKVTAYAIERIGLSVKTDAIVECDECDEARGLKAWISVNNVPGGEETGGKIIFVQYRSSRVMFGEDDLVAVMGVQAFGGSGEEAWADFRTFEWGEDGKLKHPRGAPGLPPQLSA